MTERSTFLKKRGSNDKAGRAFPFRKGVNSPNLTTAHLPEPPLIRISNNIGFFGLSQHQALQHINDSYEGKQRELLIKVFGLEEIAREGEEK